MPEICLQHLLAALLVDGRMGFASAHDRPRMQDPAVLALRSRMTLTGDDELSKAMPNRQGIVDVVMKDGLRFSEHTRHVRGTPGNPMTRQELEEKSVELLAPVLGSDAAQRLCAMVWTLEQVRDAKAFAALLRGPDSA
jgi:2-methylcitrate dehydratase PrpD